MSSVGRDSTYGYCRHDNKVDEMSRLPRKFASVERPLMNMRNIRCRRLPWHHCFYRGSCWCGSVIQRIDRDRSITVLIAHKTYDAAGLPV